MNAPVYAIPERTLRRLERLLDYFENVGCHHKLAIDEVSSSTPSAAAHEALPTFQTIGELAAKVVSDVAKRRGDDA